MKITTEEQERLENIIDWIWQIVGVVSIGILCLFVWCMAATFGENWLG